MDRVTRATLHRDMTRLAAGDRTAFDSVYDVVWPVLHAFARRLVGNPATAEDVAQQALLKVFSRAATFDPERDALTWIMAITAYECKTARKSSLRRREVDLDDALETAAASPEETAAQRQLNAALHEAMGTLSSTDAETIRAVMYGHDRGLIKPATFRKRLQRATERLKQAWRAKHGTE